MLVLLRFSPSVDSRCFLFSSTMHLIQLVVTCVFSRAYSFYLYYRLVLSQAYGSQKSKFIYY